MPVNPDFKDLFAALNAAGAEYLVVDGYALAVHAVPRFTQDLDVWVNPTAANAARVYEALRAFGAPLDQLTEDELTGADLVFQVGVAPNRIDLMTSIDGVTFEEAWPQRVDSQYGGEAIHVIGRVELRRNKLACGHPQDLVDAERLGE